MSELWDYERGAAVRVRVTRTTVEEIEYDAVEFDGRQELEAAIEAAQSAPPITWLTVDIAYEAEVAGD